MTLASSSRGQCQRQGKVITVIDMNASDIQAWICDQSPERGLHANYDKIDRIQSHYFIQDWFEREIQELRFPSVITVLSREFFFESFVEDTRGFS